MGPSGSRNTPLLLQVARKVFKLVLDCTLSGPHQITLGRFEILKNSSDQLGCFSSGPRIFKKAVCLLIHWDPLQLALASWNNINLVKFFITPVTNTQAEKGQELFPF